MAGDCSASQVVSNHGTVQWWRLGLHGLDMTETLLLRSAHISPQIQGTGSAIWSRSSSSHNTLCPPSLPSKKRKTTRINPCNPTIKHSRSHDKDFESQISMQISAPLVAVAVAAARRPGEVDRDSARCLLRAEYQGRSFRVSIENQLWLITYNYAILCLNFLTSCI